jgi:hypothetical protein
VHRVSPVGMEFRKLAMSIKPRRAAALVDSANPWVFNLAELLVFKDQNLPVFVISYIGLLVRFFTVQSPPHLFRIRVLAFIRISL